MRPRRPRRLGAALALAASLAACLAERDPLGTPQLRLELVDTVAVQGDSVRLRTVATDASGIIYIGVRLFCGDVIVDRDVVNLPPRDSVNVLFDLRVGRRAPVGAILVAEAQAIDDQDFSTLVRDTLVVRDSTGAPPPGTATPCVLGP